MPMEHNHGMLVFTLLTCNRKCEYMPYLAQRSTMLFYHKNVTHLNIIELTNDVCVYVAGPVASDS